MNVIIPDRKVLVKALDKLTGQFVRFRDKECVICRDDPENATGDRILDPGHIISRRFYATRWDITHNGNVHVQCRKHNMLHGSFSGAYKGKDGMRKGNWIKEADTVPYYIWYIKKFGVEDFEEMYNRAHQITKYSVSDLQNKYDEMAVAYQDLLSNN